MNVTTTTVGAATRRVLLTIAIVAAGLVAVLAVRIDALAHGGPHPSPLASGTTDERIFLKTHPRETSNVTTFQLGFDQAGAATPWHSHPGPGLVTINRGTFELTRVVDGTCVTQTYGPNNVFVDPGDGTVHRLVLTSGEGAVTATFITPAGSALSNPNVPAPSC